MPIDPRLVNIAIAELPDTVVFLRSLFRRADPNAPIPTDADVIAAYQQAITSSLAKDDLWLAQHPAP